MSYIKKNLSLFVLIFGIFGYLLAIMLHSTQWDLASPPFFYQIIILLKTTFISMLKMLIAPMIFFSLLAGIISIGEVSKLKTMGKTTILYYLSTTIIAIIIGLTCVKFIHPWTKYNTKINIQNAKVQKQYNYKQPSKLIDTKNTSITKLFTNLSKQSFTNPFKALATTNILGIVVSALLIGLALLIVHVENSLLYELINDINKVIYKILHWFILTTPIGVFAIIFDFKTKVSGDIFTQLLSFCLLVLGATFIHGLIVLPLIAKIFGGVELKSFFKKISKPMLLAISTSSSSATLPVSMQTCEEEFNVDKAVSAFVLPLGATMNMDGTALFEGIAAIFLAYLFNIPLSSISVFAIFFMAMISSIGAPGMPSGSMAGMQMVLLAAGIPIEAIGILLVIERPLDTFRTAVNVEGDIVGAIVTQHQFQKNSSH